LIVWFVAVVASLGRACAGSERGEKDERGSEYRDDLHPICVHLERPPQFD